MTHLSRRSLLGTAGAALGALVAGSLPGCAGGQGPPRGRSGRRTIPDDTLADLAAYYSSLR